MSTFFEPLGDLYCGVLEKAKDNLPCVPHVGIPFGDCLMGSSDRWKALVRIALDNGHNMAVFEYNHLIFVVYTGLENIEAAHDGNEGFIYRVPRFSFQYSIYPPQLTERRNVRTKLSFSDYMEEMYSHKSIRNPVYEEHIENVFASLVECPQIVFLSSMFNVPFRTFISRMSLMPPTLDTENMYCGCTCLAHGHEIVQPTHNGEPRSTPALIGTKNRWMALVRIALDQGFHLRTRRLEERVFVEEYARRNENHLCRHVIEREKLAKRGYIYIIKSDGFAPIHRPDDHNPVHCLQEYSKLTTSRFHDVEYIENIYRELEACQEITFREFGEYDRTVFRPC